MKNSVAIVFNTAYWIIFMIVVSMFYYAMTTQELVISIWPEIYWKLSVVVIAPSVLAFYLGYAYLFGQIEKKKKKRIYLISGVVVTSLIISIVWVPLVNLVWGSPVLSPLSDFFYYIQMGLPLSLLWFVQVVFGLFLRVFLKWFNNLDENDQSDASSI